MKNKGFRPVVKSQYGEDTMMSQSGIKPSPEMLQNAKDMMKKDMVAPKKKK